jgi:hypothetical protein
MYFFIAAKLSFCEQGMASWLVVSDLLMFQMDLA